MAKAAEEAGGGVVRRDKARVAVAEEEEAGVAALAAAWMVAPVAPVAGAAMAATGALAGKAARAATAVPAAEAAGLLRFRSVDSFLLAALRLKLQAGIPARTWSARRETILRPDIPGSRGKAGLPDVRAVLPA